MSLNFVNLRNSAFILEAFWFEAGLIVSLPGLCFEDDLLALRDLSEEACGGTVGDTEDDDDVNESSAVVALVVATVAECRRHEKPIDSETSFECSFSPDFAFGSGSTSTTVEKHLFEHR